MMRSLYSGVSGLKTHQTKMDVIGNNIANVNTTSYKTMSINFSDLMYPDHTEQRQDTMPQQGQQNQQDRLVLVYRQQRFPLTLHRRALHGLHG